MKLSFLALITCLSLPPHAGDEAATASNQFAFDCLKVLQQEKGNLAFSPYSAWITLAMTSAGTAGKTLEEMDKILHIARPDENEMHRQAGEWIKDLNSSIAGVELKTANRLWVDSSFVPEKDFQDLVRKDYAGAFINLDFAGAPETARQQINLWVAQQTANRIPELMPSGSVNVNTHLVLTNAIYFKGTWLKKFDPGNTRPETFMPSDGNKIVVPMMALDGTLPYFENNECQAVKIPYIGDSVSMVVILPTKTASFNLDAESFQTLWTGLKDENVLLRLPSFELSLEIDMSPLLKSLGMAIAFSNEADFSRLNKNPNLSITAVVQKIFVKTDEAGSEAAAATGVAVGTRGGPPSPKVWKIFHTNRPFLFFIVHNPSNGILFMGRVEKPGK